MAGTAFASAAGWTAVTATLALLGATAAQRLSSPYAELWSDAVSWTVLLVVATIRPCIESKPTQKTVLTDSDSDSSSRFPLDNATLDSRDIPKDAASRTLWAVAVSLGVVSMFKTEIGIIACTPAVVPLLLLVERLLNPGLVHTGRGLDTALASTFWGTAVVAVLALGTLGEWQVRGLMPSLGPTAALLVVYAAFTPRTSDEDGKQQGGRVVQAVSWLSTRLLPPILAPLTAVVRPLAWRVLAVLAAALGAEALLLEMPLPRCDIPATLALAMAKLFSWSFLWLTIRSTSSWRIASVVDTFGLVATRSPFAQTSQVHALAVVLAALASLAQTSLLLPAKTRLRPLLWLVALAPLAPFLANQLVLHSLSAARTMDQEHTVSMLVRTARADFEQTMRRQSQNATAAAAEYRRRYHIEPPPGFAEWFAFAQARDSRIIDEFDGIHERVAPLRDALSGAAIRDRIKRVYAMPGSDLWLCTFAGATTATTRCQHPSRTFDRHIEAHFDALLADVPRNVLPDVSFLVNHLDEPRVLFPSNWMAPKAAAQAEPNITDLAEQPTWDVLTQYCSQTPPDLPGVDLARGVLPWVVDHSYATDLCSHPSYRGMHGLLTSPASLPLIEGVVPVLSTGALSTMGDILVPAPAYAREPRFQYDAEHDVAWAAKRRQLYWAGSTTGGAAKGDCGGSSDGRDKPWRYLHRQRFVGLVQNLDGRWHAFLREFADGRPGGFVSRLLNNYHYDVAFSRLLQCAPACCRAQRAFFLGGGGRMRSAWAPRDAALRARLVFDLDGNGISGRYYALLASRSAPLKQTLLREWHDERLAPWVHYVPVSQGMDELPELVAYLVGDGDEGEQAARAIAEQGRAWSQQVLREADMAIYTFRLMLELARLQDPARPAGEADAKKRGGGAE